MQVDFLELLDLQNDASGHLLERRGQNIDLVARAAFRRAGVEQRLPREVAALERLQGHGQPAQAAGRRRNEQEASGERGERPTEDGDGTLPEEGAAAERRGDRVVRLATR